MSNLAQDLLRNMSDRQLQEVLSAISTAAASSSQTATPGSRRPQSTNSATLATHSAPNPASSTNGTQTLSWQNAYKPDVVKQQRRSAKPSIKPQPAVALYSQTANANPVSTQYLAAYSKPHVPPALQALQTCYASRLRTGSTVLVQPILQTTSVNPRGASRRSGMINYAEPGSGDELDANVDSDDSDFVSGGSGIKNLVKTSSTRSRGLGGYGIPLSAASPSPVTQTSLQPNTGKAELDQSYLGSIPPSRFIASKNATMTRHEYFSQAAMDSQASKSTNLIPIRVELETDTHRIRDCFLWNLHEDLITPHQFARIFCTDLELPHHPYVEQVSAAIRSQVEEHEGIATMDFTAETERQYSTDANGSDGEETVDCRVILAIDVQIAKHHLIDTIEWDLLSNLTPEEFAHSLCLDLGLSGESAPLIAHAVQEELIRHKRDAVEWGIIGGDREEGLQPQPPGRSVTPADPTDRERTRDKSGLGLFKDKTGLGLGVGGFGGRSGRDSTTRGPKRLRSVWRDWSEAEEWSTRLEELTPEEVERREIERERASRRLRRETSKFQSSNTTRRRR